MRKSILSLSLLCLAWVSPALAVPPASMMLSEETLERAFEGGCSLVIAEVLSVRSEERASRMYYYRVRVARTIVAGDLQKEEVHRPLELFAGASYGEALRVGSHYAMFISRDCPYDFSWAFRDDVVEVDPSDDAAVRRLIERAGGVYARTSILQFRRAPVAYNVEPPPLPEELASLCTAFQQRPGRRADVAEKIAESDLGSRIDDSNPGASIRSFLPPKISCSRAQMLSLLGHPTWKSGRTYHWTCDHFVHVREGGEKIGVLSATFGQDDKVQYVLYDRRERSKWIRPSSIADRLAEQEGDPAGVARRFQQALREADWDQALWFCSATVQEAARQHDRPESFFRTTVPIRDVVAREFNPHRFSSLEGKVVRMSDEASLYVRDADWSAQWTWGLARVGQTWRVDFEPISLERFMQKERTKKAFRERGSRTAPEVFDEAIRYVLIPMQDEFTVGEPMLFRLEMRNVGDESIAFYRSQVMVNDPVAVTDPNGRALPYVDTSYQTGMWPDAILPGEPIVLADRYDVTSQYRVLRPGSYTFQFKSDRRRSNVCAVEVKPGHLPVMEQIVEKLLPILPEGWQWRRSLSSRAGFAAEGPAQSLYIRLSGKPGGKANRYGMTLLILIAGGRADADPWLKERFDFWGASPWGPVYARVNEIHSLWPDYKDAITTALGVVADRPGAVTTSGP